MTPAWAPGTPSRRPNLLLAFLCRIVRNLSLMRYHGDRAAKRGGGSYTVALEELEDCLASPHTVEGEEQELVRLTRIRKQLRRSKEKTDPSIPMGQGYFNATVIEVSDSSILVKCTDSFLGKIPVGSEVQVSANTSQMKKFQKLRLAITSEFCI